MQKVIGVTELQRRFRLVFDEVVKKNVPYILTRGSRPEAALISYDDFLQFQLLREEEVFARFDALLARMSQQNADIDEGELATDVETALAEIED